MAQVDDDVRTFPLLPDVIQTEDGDTWFAAGHVDRYAFVLAFMLEMAQYESAEDAFIAVVGFADRAAWRIAAEEFIGKVQHSWWRERPDINDEAMDRCGPYDEGAQPFTEVTVDA